MAPDAGGAGHLAAAGHRDHEARRTDSRVCGKGGSVAVGNMQQSLFKKGLSFQIAVYGNGCSHLIALRKRRLLVPHSAQMSFEMLAKSIGLESQHRSDPAQYD